MAKMETCGNIEETREGNTKTSRVVPGRYWCFTWNNYPDDAKETLETIFKNENVKYLVGEEVGEQGTAHLQGFINSEKKIRPIEKFKIKEIHWEKCRGSEEDNIKYVTKDGNFWGNIRVRTPKILKDSELMAWQREVVEIVKKEPDDRTIHWYWEPDGKKFGKTTFAKYLAHKFGAIPLEGKKNDILFCAATFDSDVYIWDLERSMEDFVSYSALEKIKNGFFMCSKFESKPIIRCNPHVIVFANFPPDKSKLSADRWNIRKLEGIDDII